MYLHTYVIMAVAHRGRETQSITDTHTQAQLYLPYTHLAHPYTSLLHSHTPRAHPHRHINYLKQRRTQRARARIAMAA